MSTDATSWPLWLIITVSVGASLIVVSGFVLLYKRSHRTKCDTFTARTFIPGTLLHDLESQSSLVPSYNAYQDKPCLTPTSNQTLLDLIDIKRSQSTRTVKSIDPVSSGALTPNSLLYKHSRSIQNLRDVEVARQKSVRVAYEVEGRSSLKEEGLRKHPSIRISEAKDAEEDNRPLIHQSSLRMNMTSISLHQRKSMRQLQRVVDAEDQENRVERSKSYRSILVRREGDVRSVRERDVRDGLTGASVFSKENVTEEKATRQRSTRHGKPNSERLRKACSVERKKSTRSTLKVDTKDADLSFDSDVGKVDDDNLPLGLR